jgi:hypothetical protein
MLTPHHDGLLLSSKRMCRGSGGLAEPATSDASSGHASGSTLPQARADQQALKPKVGKLMAKPHARKRDLT